MIQKLILKGKILILGGNWNTNFFQKKVKFNKLINVVLIKNAQSSTVIDSGFSDCNV
jgi:hypothetical protein